MGYDPKKHHRRSIRLRGWDYTSPGAYFVTICTHNGQCLFEDPTLRRVVETMWQRIPRHFPHVQLDEFVVMPNHVHGIIWIVDKPVGARHSREPSSPTSVIPSDEPAQWREQSSGNASPLPPPNTGTRHSREPLSPTDTILSDEPTQSRKQPSGNASPLPHGVVPGSLGAIIGNFKSVTARRINRIRRTPGAPVWQRNYYEHIVRSEDELGRIRKYIRLNPLKWELDRENPHRTGHDPEEDWLYGE